MSWYSFETTNEHLRNALRKYCKENKIYYELSSCFNGWHFEIKCTETQAHNIEHAIENIDDCITQPDKPEIEYREIVSARNLTNEREYGHTDTVVLLDSEIEEMPPFDWENFMEFIDIYKDSCDEWEISVSYTESDGDWWKEEPIEEYIIRLA